jgi:hypothetical protein
VAKAHEGFAVQATPAAAAAIRPRSGWPVRPDQTSPPAPFLPLTNRDALARRRTRDAGQGDRNRIRARRQRTGHEHSGQHRDSQQVPQGRDQPSHAANDHTPRQRQEARAVAWWTRRRPEKIMLRSRRAFTQARARLENRSPSRLGLPHIVLGYTGTSQRTSRHRMVGKR